MKNIPVFLLFAFPVFSFAETAQETIKHSDVISIDKQTIEVTSPHHLSLQETSQANNSVVFLKNVNVKSVTSDPAKIAALKGTWIITYSYRATDNLYYSYTDKIVITGSELASGKLTAVGKLYFQQTGVGVPISCYYDPALLATVVNSDYVCYIVSDTKSYLYEFKFSGNIIIGGYYGSGVTTRNAADLVVSQSIPLFGYRSDSSSDVSYNINDGLLTIPKVQVGNDNYSAILSDQKNGLFKLERAVKQ